jgi:replication initiation and membrane attachment protein DnaB
VPITSTLRQTVSILGTRTELVQVGDFSKTGKQSVAKTIYKLKIKDEKIDGIFKEDKIYKDKSKEMNKTMENTVEKLNEIDTKVLNLSGEEGGKLEENKTKLTKNENYKEFVKKVEKMEKAKLEKDYKELTDTIKTKGWDD